MIYFHAPVPGFTYRGCQPCSSSKGFVDPQWTRPWPRETLFEGAYKSHFSYGGQLKWPTNMADSRVWRVHAEFQNEYLAGTRTKIPQNRPIKPLPPGSKGVARHTPAGATQLAKYDSAFCDVTFRPWLVPVDNTTSTGKIKLLAEAPSGTPGYDTAKRLTEDLFAHIMAFSDEGIKKIYLAMCKAEKSFVLRKFYVVRVQL